MSQHLKQITILVDDYDKAIEYYTQKLHFTLIEDTPLSESKRWVLVKPCGTGTCSLLLAKASNEIQKSRIGNQTGGRVFLFLHTDNFEKDFQNLIDNNIRIVRGPVQEEYGKVAVFEDLFGNLWDLIEPIKENGNPDVRHSYNLWAEQYDSNINRTRDLEAKVIRNHLADVSYDNCLEIGCGTGKNTEWLLSKAKRVIAVDLSDEMLSRAKQKITSNRVQFIQADINEDWSLFGESFDLVSFSLVLEHLENLNEIFRKVSQVTRPGCTVYIGELHPFKQYAGSKARFDVNEGQHVVKCFTHSTSDFLSAAKANDFVLTDLQEYFDENNQNGVPRVLVMLFSKKS
jgi:ubiquinone/menaquinone biosynthesis C-methylase UbiE/uncharacterized glyoxalase superfamily protein PhnB